MKDITVALGGGGVKGNAHIGVLRVLEREGFHIQAIAGTSAGGLWGAFYAAGFSPDEIEAMMLRADRSALYARRPGDGPSFLGVTGLHNLLIETFQDRTFDDLRIPFAVTAVDVDTARLITISQGRLVDAILATIAVPGIFPPVRWNGYTLIDGGVLDPVPISIARSLANGLPVVAVVLSPPLDEWPGPDRPRLLNSLPFLSSYINRLRIAQALDVFMRSVDIGGAKLTDLRLQLEKPEVIIRPDVRRIGLLDNVNVTDVARMGELAAEQALPALYEALTWRRRLGRRFRSMRSL